MTGPDDTRDRLREVIAESRELFIEARRANNALRELRDKHFREKAALANQVLELAAIVDRQAEQLARLRAQLPERE